MDELFEKIRKHPIVSLCILVISVVGLTWTVLVELLVAPRDFTIQQLETRRARMIDPGSGPITGVASPVLTASTVHDLRHRNEVVWYDGIGAAMDGLKPGTAAFAKYDAIDSFGEFPVFPRSTSAGRKAHTFFEVHKLHNDKNYLLGFTNEAAVLALRNRATVQTVFLFNEPDVISMSVVAVAIPTLRVNSLSRQNMGPGYLVEVLPY